MSLSFNKKEISAQAFLKWVSFARGKTYTLLINSIINEQSYSFHDKVAILLELQSTYKIDLEKYKNKHFAIKWAILLK